MKQTRKFKCLSVFIIFRDRETRRRVQRNTQERAKKHSGAKAKHSKAKQEKKRKKTSYEREEKGRTNIAVPF